jgi:hypothetical protein
VSKETYSRTPGTQSRRTPSQKDGPNAGRIVSKCEIPGSPILEIQEKVPYMCTGKGTLYVYRNRHLVCVQEKVPYMCTGKATLYVYRNKHLICVQEKVP